MTPTFDPSLAPALLEKTTYIWEQFCQGPEVNASCDEYFLSNNFSRINAIPGLASGIISGRCVCVCACVCVCIRDNIQCKACNMHFDERQTEPAQLKH